MTRLIGLILLIVVAQSAHSSSDRVYRVQTILNSIGQNAGIADGLYGGKTRRALIAIAPEHNGKTITDADVHAVEEAYIEKFGNYPVFGSKNSPLPMKIKEKYIGEFAGWNEQIKTEMHRLDVSTVNFEFMPFEYYAKDASAHPPSETPTWAQIQASRYDCDFALKNMRVRDEDVVAGTLTKAGKGSAGGTGWCNTVLREKFPYEGASDIQNVLNLWTSKPVDYFAPQLSNGDDINGKNIIYAQLTATYALFYDRFTDQQKIDKWLIDWGLRFERTKGINASQCPFHNPILMNNDRRRGGKFSDASACGSEKWRSAFAKIALGLRIKNQEIYLSGVRHLEANLAMIDENGIYVHYASRGWQSPGYLVDVPLYLNDLGILFHAVGLDFYSIQTPSGLTIAEIIDASIQALDKMYPLQKYIEGTGIAYTNANVKETASFGQLDTVGGFDYIKLQSQTEPHDLLMRTLHYNATRRAAATPPPEKIIRLVSFYMHDNSKPQGYHGFGADALPLIPVMHYLREMGRLNKSFAGAEDFTAILKETKQKRAIAARDPQNIIKNPEIRASLGLDPEPEIILEHNLNKGDFVKLELPVDFDYWHYFNVNQAKLPGKKSRDSGFAFDVMRMGVSGNNTQVIGSVILKNESGTLIMRRASGEIEAEPNQVVGQIEGDFFTITLKTKLCDTCRAYPEKIIVSRDYHVGIGLKAEESDKKTRLVVMPY